MHCGGAGHRAWGTPAPTRPPGPRPLPAPGALAPFAAPATAGAGSWRTVGRPVDGHAAVYETMLVPPGGNQPAGLAWMDANLLSARLYSGSISPGGGPYRFTAPIRPAQAASVVAAFNGGFKMKDSHGGHYTQGREVEPPRGRAAPPAIDRRGTVDTDPRVSVFRIAGLLVLASIALGVWASIYWLWLGVFVGANMLQASFTGFCPLAKILAAMGVKPGMAFCKRQES